MLAVDRKVVSMGHVKRIALLSVGWLLVAVGLVAMVLPGPGLLALFAGLALLSQHYEWARRRVGPVKTAALRAAAEGVQSWRRILVSLLAVSALVAAGIVWGLGTPVPGWWPLPDSWWLPGGWGTGATLIVSALAAFALLVYSYRRFRYPE